MGGDPQYPLLWVTACVFCLLSIEESERICRGHDEGMVLIGGWSRAAPIGRIQMVGVIIV